MTITPFGFALAIDAKVVDLQCFLSTLMGDFTNTTVALAQTCDPNAR